MSKQGKYKVNDYSRLNKCSRRKIAFLILAATTSRSYHESFLTVSTSSLLHVSKQKERKLRPEKARCACVTRLSHLYVFPARFPSSVNARAFLWCFPVNSQLTFNQQRIFVLTASSFLAGSIGIRAG